MSAHEVLSVDFTLATAYQNFIHTPVFRLRVEEMWLQNRWDSVREFSIQVPVGLSLVIR